MITTKIVSKKLKLRSKELEKIIIIHLPVNSTRNLRLPHFRLRACTPYGGGGDVYVIFFNFFKLSDKTVIYHIQHHVLKYISCVVVNCS